MGMRKVIDWYAQKAPIVYPNLFEDFNPVPSVGGPPDRGPVEFAYGVIGSLSNVGSLIKPSGDATAGFSFISPSTPTLPTKEILIRAAIDPTKFAAGFGPELMGWDVAQTLDPLDPLYHLVTSNWNENSGVVCYSGSSDAYSYFAYVNATERDRLLALGWSYNANNDPKFRVLSPTYSNPTSPVGTVATMTLSFHADPPGAGETAKQTDIALIFYPPGVMNGGIKVNWTTTTQNSAGTTVQTGTLGTFVRPTSPYVYNNTMMDILLEFIGATATLKIGNYTTVTLPTAVFTSVGGAMYDSFTVSFSRHVSIDSIEAKTLAP